MLAVAGAGAAIVVLGALVLRREELAVAATALLGAAYTGALLLRGDELDERAPLYAGLLLLLPELVAWSAQSAPPVDAESGLARARLAALASGVALAVAASGAVLAATAMGGGGGLAWEALGVAAAVAALGLLAALGRRP